MIIGIIGKMGSGKTLFTSILANKAFDSGCSIYANYGLKFEHKTLNMNDILTMSGDLQNAMICIDEIHLFMDSRQSMSKRSRIISYFITQSRKRNLVLIYTTQNAHQVDKRLRSNTDYIIQCDNLTPGAKSDVIIRVNIHDTDNNSRVFAFRGDPYFCLYDTHQIIDFTQHMKDEK